MRVGKFIATCTVYDIYLLLAWYGNQSMIDSNLKPNFDSHYERIQQDKFDKTLVRLQYHYNKQ